MTKDAMHNQPKIAMVIDDNEIDQLVARSLITASGFANHIISVASASKALTYLKTNEKQPEKLPDLIFLDIHMPEMDGFEFLKEYHLLTSEIKAKVRIVMLSSSTDSADQAKARKTGHVLKFLSKPLNLEELEKLDQLLINKNSDFVQMRYDG
ncbi:MAG: response regulator [Cyclobacteriaceae bacterium]|nr:response regulator [Cyclobacteriaceae bacterium]